ncbi:hypothetical protein [Arthrobacter sp.]|uniref:hypothetical protein n=1 Tax=Arthrobacter sp. TaxID=1667 RepID=UPI003A93FAC5
MRHPAAQLGIVAVAALLLSGCSATAGPSAGDSAAGGVSIAASPSMSAVAADGAESTPTVSAEVDAVLAPLPKDLELARTSGQGAAGHVMDIGHARHINIYGVCWPGDGTADAAPHITVSDDSGIDVAIVCDGVVTRSQQVGAMHGRVSVDAPRDTRWGLLAADPRGK